jgi:predicted aminopeptidase
VTDSHETSGEGEPGDGRARRLPRPLLLVGVLLPLALLLFSCSGCSPVYLAKAGWAEMKILRGRRPFDEVINDTRTDGETRRKLLLARQARAFAIHMLRLEAGDSYTSFTQLETDTLAWVLSAAHRDRFESKTWWFPIVGRMPYKGYFSEDGARKAQDELEREGLDTYLRTTSAFSTLGWFADPLVSSLLRYDDVNLVETILHELSHNHLFVKGNVRFNESFATFVGRTGAIRFFCGPEEVPQDVPKCQMARERWADYQGFSRFLDEFIGELEAVYGAPDMAVEDKIAAREELFRSYQSRFQVAEGMDPSPISPAGSNLVQSFLGRPLNNAILLARMRYFHRLSDFQALLDQHDGDLKATVAELKERAPSVDDPFELLPEGPPL